MPRFEFKPLAGADGVTSREGRFSLAGVDGAVVPGGRIRVWLGPRKVGGRYFRLFIDPGAGRAEQRLAQGLYNDGPYPGQNWAEIFDLDPPDGLDLSGEWESGLAPFLRPLAAAVPPGGHVMIEYEKPLFRTTQVGLLGGIPAIATPMGQLLHDIGAGDSFKDWYFPEGGQEGGRKLQGNKAYTPQQAQEMAAKRIRELRVYLAAPPRGEEKIEARARRDAQALLDALSE